MQIGDQVQAYSGPYTGYYGTIVELGSGVARVSHKPDFFGFWIDEADMVPPLLVEVEADE